MIKVRTLIRRTVLCPLSESFRLSLLLIHRCSLPAFAWCRELPKYILNYSTTFLCMLNIWNIHHSIID